MKKKLELSAPWIIYYRKLEALFGDDPDIRIEYDNDEVEVKMYVNGDKKAEAISQLLPPEKKWGNVALKITVIPDNELAISNIGLFEEAFKGNPAFRYIEVVTGPISNTINFVVFEPKVVQYFTDNAGDIHGLESTLYHNIAREVFEENSQGIYFCVDKV